MAIIRQSLARPIARYTATCSALAKEHRIPTLAFVAAADLRDGDFYDFWHLVKPGRAKWQALLSARTATLLLRYGAGGAAGWGAAAARGRQGPVTSRPPPHSSRW